VHDQRWHVNFAEVLSEVFVPGGHASETGGSRGAGCYVPACLHSLFADALVEKEIRVVEILEELREERVAIRGDRFFDPFEDTAVNPFRIVYFRKGKITLQAERHNNKNLFFRPVGLEVLARLYFRFAQRNKLNALRYALKSLHFQNPGGVFDGILWNAGKIEASAKAKKAAVEFCLYLLHELPVKDEAKLTGALRELTKKYDYVLPPRSLAPPNSNVNWGPKA
jgi:hypothetical protein